MFESAGSPRTLPAPSTSSPGGVSLVALRAGAVSPTRATQVDGDRIRAHLEKLCKDPVLQIRHAGDPTYRAAAEYVGEELAKAGFAPFGDDGADGRSFLSGFRWKERYGDKPVSSSYNVVGVLEGSGEAPRRSVVLVAHLDNLSSREKAHYEGLYGRDMHGYEGANDNTASVAAVLEAARALAAGPALDCDLVVMIPSAEEDGLKGTEAFVMAPPMDLDRVLGVINLEMIGRNITDEMLVFGGERRADTEANALYQRAKRVAAANTLPAKPGYANDDGNGWNSRSDHYVFQQAGVPAIMLHGRATSESYHTNQDVVEALNMEKVEVAARLACEIARDLATDPEPTERRGPPKARLNHYSGKVWPGLEGSS